MTIELMKYEKNTTVAVNKKYNCGCKIKNTIVTIN